MALRGNPLPVARTLQPQVLGGKSLLCSVTTAFPGSLQGFGRLHSFCEQEYVTPQLFNWGGGGGGDTL